jgi:hypothetical protein
MKLRYLWPVLLCGRVWADDEQPPAPPPPPPPPAVPAPPDPALQKKLEELDQRVQKVEDDLAQAKDDNAYLEDKVKELLPLSGRLSGYVDIGFFGTTGNGAGTRSDLAGVYFPEYVGKVPGSWVFMGDPLSTAINSLGEPADTSDSREVATDTLHSGGHPSLILNSLGLAIRKDVTDEISVWSLAELLPRPTGDRLDVELAYIEYQPKLDNLDLRIQAGKVDSVLGIEYRSQDAPRRLTVTPSLIGRYTSGRELGIDARLVSGPISASAALVNGDFFDRRFEPTPSLHANALPTGAAHLQYTLPVGNGLEVGVSGAVGPQTNQPDLDILQWHIGFDLRLTDFHQFDVQAEYVQGLLQGKTVSPTPCDAAPCLDYKGAYLLVDHRVSPHFTPYARIDWRDAVHENGATFVYESHVLRQTIGARLSLTSRILWKLEYTFNEELDNIPSFADDIITTSVVVATD